MTAVVRSPLHLQARYLGVACLILVACGEANEIGLKGRIEWPEADFEVSCPTPKLSLEYPPTLTGVQEGYRNCMTDKFREILDARLSHKINDASCYVLNAYGEIEPADWCGDSGGGGFFARQETDALDAVKYVLTSLQGYSGVTSTSILTPIWKTADLMEPDSNCTLTCRTRYSTFTFDFGPQHFAGLEIVGSELSAEISIDGVVRIKSSWRTDISLSAVPDVSADSAGQQLVGMKLGYANFGGNIVYDLIGSDDIGISKLLIKRQRDYDRNEITYHLVWSIDVLDGRWTAYVDAITGDVIWISQNFST